MQHDQQEHNRLTENELMFIFLKSLLQQHRTFHQSALILTMLTSEIESILAILMLIPTTTGGPVVRQGKNKRS